MIDIYINDVIERVEQLRPSEYDVSEMYMWCDEVSAMLTVEDRRFYREKKLIVGPDGCILLPEDISIENVEFILDGIKRIHKRDLRSVSHRHILLPHHTAGDTPRTVRVVYFESYEPIRLTKYKGELVINKSDSSMIMNDCEFVSGDTLIIEDHNDFSDPIPLLKVRFAPDDETCRRFVLYTAYGALDPLSKTHYTDAVVRRIVDEMTVCEPPFDSMYVDYIHAKISLYQGETSVYNQFMTSFNSKLAAYKKWLCALMPKVRREFTGWY